MNFIKITEQPSIYEDLEQKSVRELLEGINEEDRKVASAVHACIPQIEKLVNEIVERMHQGGRIFYLGAGTSGRLGVLDASEIPPTFGMPDTCVIGIIAGGEQALRRPVENAEDDSQKGWMELQDHHITNKDILIGIAASGTTPYVIGALQKAREHGILTASISSNPGSPLSSVADIPIEMIVGPEFITGSSRMKSGTGQKMILNMISTTVMIKLGRVKGNRMVNMQLSNRKLIDRGVQMLIDELHINKAEAKQLLQEQGSVKKALDAYKTNNCITKNNRSMKSWKLEAVILAIGMLVMGYFIKQGLDTFSGKDRVVNVKGLAEMEVPANKVTWPLMYKDLGNDLPTLYNKINATNQAIVGFLKQKGITENEISINAPEIIDMQAERYNNKSVPFRYNVTSVITVTSTKVDLVRKMISEQSELLKQGIAITGGDYRYNVQYDYTGLNDIKPQMIEEATKNARAAAVKFAKDSDSELGKIKRAYQGQFSIEDRDANTPYIKRIRVVTTIDYSLED